MRVLMIVRDTLYTSPGGDTIQVLSTAKYLKLNGLTVDVMLTSQQVNYDDYDIMHFFNIIRPDDILPHITKSKLKFVVSTIFVDYSEYEKNDRKGIFKIVNKILNSDQIEYLKTIARLLVNGTKINSAYYLLHGQRKSVRYVAERASMLLPNSNSEYERFKKAYNLENSYKKIPNAVDISIFDENMEADSSYDGHILCVGRIEGRKNQLNLIKAIEGTNYFLTLIGKSSPNHIRYFNECKSLVDKHKNMQIIEHIEQHQLASIYKAAKVHVLPSWFETTGLSSLEAAIMGCNIVVTKKGDTEEYFEDMAYYCEPDNIQSIRNAIELAWNSQASASLRSVIFENYSWQKAAEKTLAAYNDALKNQKCTLL